MRKFDVQEAEGNKQRAKGLANPNWVLRRKCYSTVDSTVAPFDATGPAVTKKTLDPNVVAQPKPPAKAPGLGPATLISVTRDFNKTCKAYDELVSTLPKKEAVPAEARVYGKPLPVPTTASKHVDRGFNYLEPPAAYKPPLLPSPRKAPKPVVVLRPEPLNKRPQTSSLGSPTAGLRSPTSAWVGASPGETVIKSVHFATPPADPKPGTVPPVANNLGLREELGRPSAASARPGVGGAVMKSRADAWGGGSTWARGSIGFGQHGLL